MKKKQRRAHDKVAIKGFSRVQIVEDGRVVGDSGFVGPNLVVNLGFEQFLVRTLGGMASSKTVSHVALGSGGAPAATDTSLAGEVMSSTQRKTVTAAVVASKTQQFTATFASVDSFVSTTFNISNVGLFNTSSGGTIFAGNTYTSSLLNTNQDVNVTYEIRFSAIIPILLAIRPVLDMLSSVMC
jgi:hypothetical protein